jgi:chlorobactene glucosyltransferase
MTPATAHMILLIMALLAVAAALLIFAYNYQTVPHLDAQTYPHSPSPAPLVSVLVPARNEEHNIGRCLRSLLQQDYPALEIMVIDDRSTDRTAEIVREMQKAHGQLRLIPGRELPPGWIGKNHALYQGVQEAQGTYLLFVDADVTLAPSCIRQTVSYAVEHHTDLVTVSPTLVSLSFWEKVVLPVIGQLVVSFFPLSKINNPHSNLVLVTGPYLLFKRETYQRIGGHERFKGEIVEDLVLGKALKQAGYRLNYLLGTELVSLRMYTDLKGIWEGFSKNFFVGMEQRVWLAAVLALLLCAVLVVPWLSLITSLGYVWLGKWQGYRVVVLTLSSAQCLLTLFHRWVLHRYVQLDNTYPYLQPLGALVIVGILTNSTLRVLLRKGISWKGRVYSGGRAAT